MTVVTVFHMILGTVPLLLAVIGAYLRLRSRIDALEVHMSNMKESSAAARGELAARIALLDERKVDALMCRGMHEALAAAIEALRKHRARAIELGINEYLGKPYQESQLLEAIEPLVRQRKVKS